MQKRRIGPKASCDGQAVLLRVVLRRAMLGQVAVAVAIAFGSLSRGADDPPALNPFGKRSASRPDARPGVIELSDGKLHPGTIYLTRDTRLKIFDQELQKIREVPLRVIRTIDCRIDKEWHEREWRFREAANNEKVYTGRNYPARIYSHKLTLNDGRTIEGPLSAPIYVREDGKEKPLRFILHKRDKGPIGSTLKSMIYVKRIEFGEQATARARIRAERQESKKRKQNEAGMGQST